MNRLLMRNGFIAAGLMNIAGVLLLSRVFTNVAINKADPVVMSNFGLLMIVVWGLAYLGAATITANIKFLAGAFALEKLVYVVVWGKWLSRRQRGGGDAAAGRSDPLRPRGTRLRHAFRFASLRRNDGRDHRMAT